MEYAEFEIVFSIPQRQSVTRLSKTGEKLFSWTSASNCARIYNTMSMSQSLKSSSPPIPWPFSQSVTTTQVYDAFTLLSLLEDCQLQKSALVVPHKGSLHSGNRFSEAVCQRNEHYRLYTRSELFHYCTKCTRFLPGTVPKVHGLIW